MYCASLKAAGYLMSCVITTLGVCLCSLFLSVCTSIGCFVFPRASAIDIRVCWWGRAGVSAQHPHPANPLSFIRVCLSCRSGRTGWGRRPIPPTSCRTCWFTHVLRVLCRLQIEKRSLWGWAVPRPPAARLMTCWCAARRRRVDN